MNRRSRERSGLKLPDEHEKPRCPDEQRENAYCKEDRTRSLRQSHGRILAEAPSPETVNGATSNTKNQALYCE